jgi:hypothetical protein
LHEDIEDEDEEVDEDIDEDNGSRELLEETVTSEMDKRRDKLAKDM